MALKTSLHSGHRTFAPGSTSSAEPITPQWGHFIFIETSSSSIVLRIGQTRRAGWGALARARIQDYFSGHILLSLDPNKIIPETRDKAWPKERGKTIRTCNIKLIGNQTEFTHAPFRFVSPDWTRSP
jgi:hypothetical protein